MVEIGEKVFTDMVNDGFFDDWQTMKNVIKELSRSGYSIKGKKVGNIGQSLTRLCQKKILEREEVLIDQVQIAGGMWKYKKRKSESD